MILVLQAWTFECKAVPPFHVILLVHSLLFVGLLCEDLDIFIIMLKISLVKVFELSSQRLHLTMLVCLVWRFKRDTSKTEVKPKPEAPTLATRRGERSESFPVEQRSGRDLERKDFRSDTEKVDTQRASWRNDNRKNNREIEKPVERRPEPETWRKPVEQPTKPEVSGTVSRLGKQPQHLNSPKRSRGRSQMPGLITVSPAKGAYLVGFRSPFRGWRTAGISTQAPTPDKSMATDLFRNREWAGGVTLMPLQTTCYIFHGLHFGWLIRQIFIGMKRIWASGFYWFLRFYKWSKWRLLENNPFPLYT